MRAPARWPLQQQLLQRWITQRTLEERARPRQQAEEAAKGAKQLQLRESVSLQGLQQGSQRAPVLRLPPLSAWWVLAASRRAAE
jgi:hypothetical protein